jgi:tryptophan synthase beta subunit
MIPTCLGPAGDRCTHLPALRGGLGRCGDVQARAAALQLLCRLEGIIPALETAHAFTWLEKLCPTLAPGTEVVLNLSGRGDKDVNTVAEKLGDRMGG